MQSVDTHAHLTPQSFIRATQAGQTWHGLRHGEHWFSPASGLCEADQPGCSSNLPTTGRIATGYGSSGSQGPEEAAIAAISKGTTTVSR